GTGGCTAGHRWVHCWAQVGDLLGTGGWHCWAHVGGTAGHRWGHCRVAQVGALLGTADRNLRGSLLGTDHQGTDHQCPESVPIPALTTAGSRQLSSRSDSVRKVQPRTGTC
ncbi:unnamed protein product, partial [Staurois parvus]